MTRSGADGHRSHHISTTQGPSMSMSSHRIRAFVAVLLAALLALPSLAGAQQRPRQHEGGILIRLSAGLGPASADLDLDTGQKFEMNKVGGNHNLALGGIVGGNVALHATAFGWALGDPSFDLDGQDQPDLKGTVSMNAIGGGATWYLMPINIYVSGSVGFAWLSVSDDDRSFDTGVGGALDITVGKEWWVSDRWGLGVALGLQGYAVPADDGKEFTGGSISARFTATFN